MSRNFFEMALIFGGKFTGQLESNNKRGKIRSKKNLWKEVYGQTNTYSNVKVTSKQFLHQLSQVQNH